MSRLEENRYELKKLQEKEQLPKWMNQLHPLGKLFICVFYILMVTSVNKYDLSRLILLGVYPVFCFIIGELSLIEGLYRMRLILPLVIFAGIFNPFFDRTVIFYMGSFAVTGGMLSMVTLIIKGFLTVASAYILIAVTSIDEICYALRCIHIPKVIVITVMLIYRYFDVMAEEAERITTAYKLRAPAQKGIHYKVWGTLVGQWLLRSMDRAERVYESMLLRGFKGDIKTYKRKARSVDILFPLIWTAILIVIRFV